VLERLINLLFFSILLTGLFITYFNTTSALAYSIESLNSHRRAMQVLLNLSRVNLTGSANSLIEEPLINQPGFRVEVTDLEDNITWFYGEVKPSFSVGAPLIVNNHLGRVIVSCGLNSQ